MRQHEELLFCVTLVVLYSLLKGILINSKKKKTKEKAEGNGSRMLLGSPTNSLFADRYQHFMKKLCSHFLSQTIKILRQNC